ncbi:MAG TPA: hypothetical protein VFP92_00860 [Rhodanobacteraceae bacterium]|nr:hypothetical protein [Rhodanobacteraceae bacterium]
MTTVISTFTASNGTQSKTLVHDFNVAAAASAPTFVAGAGDYPYPGVSSIPLPAGCQAGDEVVICGNSASTSNAISVTGGTQWLAAVKLNGSKYLTVYTYTLTATDIANGSFPADVTYSYALGVWRAPNGVGVDVAGTVKALAAFDLLTVNDITTTVDHTTLVPIFGRGQGGTNDVVPTPYPTGYALAHESPINGYGVAMLYFDDFTPAGTTATPSFGQDSFSVQTFMLALKPL